MRTYRVMLFLMFLEKVVVLVRSHVLQKKHATLST